MSRLKELLDHEFFQNKLTLAFLLILGFATTRFTSIGIHEILGHGLFTELFGGRFYAVYVSPGGGFAILHLPLETPMWTCAIIYSAGIIVQLVFGLVIFFLVYRFLKSFLTQFFALLYGVTLLVHPSIYLGLGVFFGGDSYSISKITGIPPSVFFFSGLILSTILFYEVSKRFLSFIQDYFVLDSKKGVVYMLMVFWLSPLLVIVFSGIVALLFMSCLELIYVFSFVCVNCVLAVLIVIVLSTSFRKGENGKLSMNLRDITVVFVVFMVVVSTWLGVFGLTTSTAHGLLVGLPPPEEERYYIDFLVGNVRVTVHSNLTIDVETMTRGIIWGRSPLDHKIWETFRDRPDWVFYRSLSSFTISGMFDLSEIEINDMYIGDSVWSSGTNYSNARVCTASINGTNASSITKVNNTFVLTIHDPWKPSGYLDAVNITWDDEIVPINYSTTQDNTIEPCGGVDKGFFLWLNKDRETAPSKYVFTFEITQD